MIYYCIKNPKGRLFLLGLLLMLSCLLLHLLQLTTITIQNIILFLGIICLGYPISKDVFKDIFVHKELNVDFLMILSAVGAIIIGYFEEAAVLLIIFLGAEILESFVSSKSTKAVESLMQSRKTTAHFINEKGEIIEKSIFDLKINDIVFVKKGEQVPIDGVCQSTTTINESLLTGESLPIKKIKGDPVYAGTLNEGQAFQLNITQLAEDTIFSKIIELVKEAQNRPSKVANQIEELKNKYVIAILITVPLFIFYLYLIQHYSLQDAFYRGMILLTVASPCALIVSAVPATLSAINQCAKQGILVKDGNLFQKMTQLNTFFTDKTGTLTTGQFQVIKYDLTNNLLSKVIYMEQQSSHPLAKAIVQSFKNISVEHYTQEVIEIPGYGLTMGELKIGNREFFESINNPFENELIPYYESNILYIGNKDNILGYFVLQDNLRSNARNFVTTLQEKNIDVYMLTGDKEGVAKQTANQLDIKQWRSRCKPQDKMAIVSDFINKHQIVAMLGDGINDAPALANADISIAMGEGTASAMESSDMVILHNDLSKILIALTVSQKLKKIISQNIIFSIGVICLLILLTISGILDLTKGVVFHEASTILVICNSLRLLKKNPITKIKTSL